MDITGDHTVIGLGFGDEGKGHVVDWLCAQASSPVVYRFSGGPQAAHHVVLPDGTDHVFSHFGSGTLRGAPTYWMEDCLTNPIALINEHDDLLKKGFDPTLWIHARSPIITPYEVAENEGSESTRRHGSCGAGICATLRRECEHYHIWFEDLFHPTALKLKMEQLSRIYTYHRETLNLDDFFWACDEAVNRGKIDGTENMSVGLGPSIFEGSQGLLLDQNFGFFPHVTPANTGTKNVSKAMYGEHPADVWLVTRAYMTRHGAGPMTNTIEHRIHDNPYEKQREDGMQGKFRRGVLDLDLLQYAAIKDKGIVHPPNLVVTCMDLLGDPYCLFKDGKVHTCASREEFLERIATAVAAGKVYVSTGPTANDIEEVV